MSQEPKIQVQYTMQPEEEIDLKEIIKKLFQHKNIIIIFTTIVTILAVLYAFSKKPIYEIKSEIQIGYMNSNSNSKKYFLNPTATKIYIQNIYKKDYYSKIKYPTVIINIPKHINNIYNLDIQAYTNKQALNYLYKILNDLKNKELKKLYLIKQTLNQKILIFKKTDNELKKQLLILSKKLKITKNPQLYSVILININNDQNEITKNILKINKLKNSLSPINIVKTHIIGNIKQSSYPIKPKKKLIIITGFITGFILSIFLVFFIEFIKSFKEEKE